METIPEPSDTRDWKTIGMRVFLFAIVSIIVLLSTAYIFVSMNNFDFMQYFYLSGLLIVVIYMVLVLLIDRIT